MTKVVGQNHSIEIIGLINSLVVGENDIDLYNFTSSPLLKRLESSYRRDVIMQLQALHSIVNSWPGKLNDALLKASQSESELGLPAMCVDLFRMFNRLGTDQYDVEENPLLKYNKVRSWSRFENKNNNVCFHNLVDLVTTAVDRRTSIITGVGTYSSLTNVYIVVPSISKCELRDTLDSLYLASKRITKQLKEIQE